MSPEKNPKKSFTLLLSISSLTKIADLLISPKTTLPYILSANGAPAWLISMLVPVKESGSLIPQWLLKSRVAQRFNNRSALWRIGAVMQGLGSLLLVLTIAMLDNLPMAIGVMTLLIAMAGGRAICSLKMKDIQAETVDKGYRGKLIGLASSLSGGITLFSAFVFVLSKQPLTQQISYSLIIVGGVMFILSLLLSIPLNVAYESDNGTHSQLSLIGLIRLESNLRHIIVSRILLLHSALVVPFIVANAATDSNPSSSLPYFVGLSALASLVSSYIWGIFSDKGSLTTLRVASLICFVAMLIVGLEIESIPSYSGLVLFFILTLGHAGIRTGRKTYLLDITDRSTRTGYVAAGNSCVGIGLLILGALYAYAYSIIGTQIVLMMAVIMVIGVLHSYKLERVK